MAISAKFEADFSQFKTAVEGAAGSLKSLETTSQTVGGAIAAGLASAELRTFALQVRDVATQFITAFAEEQAAVSRVTTALQAQGTFTPELAKRYADLGAEFQRTTRFSDDAIFATQALLIQVGGVMPNQMQAALTAITNLAAGMGPQVGGLQGATMLVAKAFAGGSEHLGRLKILLGESLQPGADMAGVLEAINKKFGGQAAADMQTYTGRTEALKNQLSDFHEKVGQLLVNSLTPLLNAFARLPESMQTTIIAVTAIGTALAPLALTIGTLVPAITAVGTAIGGTAGLAAAFAGIVKYLGPAGIIAAGIVSWFIVFKNLDVFIWAAKTGWEMLVGVFKSAASSITASAQAVYDGVKGWLVDRFQAIVGWVQEKIAAIVASFRAMYMAVSGGSIVPDMVKGIESEFRKLDRVMVQPVIRATRQTVGEFGDMGGAVLSPAAAAGGGGGGGTVTQTFYVNGTAEDAAKKIAQIIQRSVLDGLKVGA